MLNVTQTLSCGNVKQCAAVTSTVDEIAAAVQANCVFRTNATYG